MEETLISFETAKLAKEKGYINRECKQFNRIGTHTYESTCSVKVANDLNFVIPRPTQSLLQKWLRDIHKLHIYIETTPEFDKTQGSKYKSAVAVAFQPFRWTTAHYYLGDTYEEALEAAIFKALSLIKSK